ncbi:MAG: fructose-6-phosphate aldolase [Anaeromyxobacter sp. RBG_16_69_14]|jgi:transaldolase|nr:MAG: fructose-6-phosphate aldolase [Anaeromyxobacter sp. RBG_16_69_14]
MQFFIDTADVGEIKKALAMGLCDGVTTNPSLVAKTGRKFSEVLKEITAIVPGPVSAEVTAVDYEGMMKEGRQYAKVAENIVVKVPLIVEGLHAVRDLTVEGIRTNVTLCFSAVQALLAAKAGATYVSPFVGRLDDISEDGMALIAQILEIFRNYDFATKVLVASVRHPIHVLQAARLGADVATIPFNVIEQLAKHPLTESGLKKFLADWEKVPK